MSLDTAPRSAPKIDTARIRRFLEEELREREAIIREASPNAAPNVDPVSWATSKATQRVMDQITAALDRLEAGTYGRCIRCGGAIVAARLDIMPYAENCIDCQRDVDRR
ncbi:TraR/DksA family transcriptional regulator [Microbacterium sp. SLBN-154]|uniref:TraR/DksA family transcriptional regulator n=1 Tax=Microbacterium sp. SLBN-154 TaxID=2768458 RepID=UPI0011524B51|nr:TraR/DksA family transcriptional regulator [Microbacterium sp. SLBN-154]TQK18607.1 TraR/DksA family transcriptional regulator [Microbacterium sp. SLBN-154]